MSSACHRGRFRTWCFSHILHTSLHQQASSGLASSTTINPEDVILSLFQNLFKIQEKPECVVYIHLRVTREAFDDCVSCGKAGVPLPDLPYAGYMQANSAIQLNRLIQWLDIQWDPIGGSLRSHSPYRKDFLDPNQMTAVAFVYFPVHGIAAVGKCGRKSKSGVPPKAPAVNHCSMSIMNSKTPMLHYASACIWLITWLIPHLCNATIISCTWY